MQTGLDPETVRVLRDLNPWWVSPGSVRPSPPPYRRRLVREVFTRLSGRGRLIEILRGPRQVGKTTALSQIIEDLLARGVPPQDVLFVRFDHQMLREVVGGISALARWHAGEIRGSPRDSGRPAYVFLDEVHKLRRWDEQVKHLFDTFPVRLVVTGSSSVLVSRGGRESLAGRALTSDLPTFQFREVLDVWEPDAESGLPPPVRFGTLFGAAVPREFSKGFCLDPRRKDVLLQALDRYYARGGYPRLHTGEVPEERRADYLVETVFERVLGVDIPDLFPVEQPALMRHVYLMVARRTGQEISQVSLAESANAAGYRTNQPTVGKYLHYLAEALLVREFRRYPLARRASARVPAKVALADLGVRHAILREAPSLRGSSPDVVGPLVETLVQSVIRDVGLQVHYYREYQDPRNRRSPLVEVDYVAEAADGTVLPIEVKFRKSIDAADTKGLRHFMAKFRSPCGILVTRDDLAWDGDGRILAIPLLDFLLRLG